jgi:hypothetical protein
MALKLQRLLFLETIDHHFLAINDCSSRQQQHHGKTTKKKKKKKKTLKANDNNIYER